MTGADLGTQDIFERETNLFEEDFEENEWEFLSLVNEDFDFPTATKVSNSSESESALLCAKRRQKAPQIFLSKSATISA